MADLDLIARIYAVAHTSGVASDALRASSHYYVGPQTLGSPRRRPRGSREATPQPKTAVVLNTQPFANDGCVELRFSKAPPSSYGFLFGCSPRCDVVLPNRAGFSNYHFSITFDDNRYLIVRDLESLTGTQVTYDNEGKGLRSGFRWIVGGHFETHDKSITVTISHDVEFQIVVPWQRIRVKEQAEKADIYRAGQSEFQGLFKNLDAKFRADTERPTGVYTPKKGPIHLRRLIGRGGFARAVHVWNVSTADECIIKEPRSKFVDAGRVNVQAWKEEIYIMQLISAHNSAHIVKFFDARLYPQPRILLEYVPEGALDKQKNISTAESWMILKQCLSALTYLHNHDPPIVHRDIKAGNILVQARDKDRNYIHVKLSDFGLSRECDSMSTFCGTCAYIAPEVYLHEFCRNHSVRNSPKYGPAADIWSLGVVVYELVCPLPKWRKRYIWLGTSWGEEILEMLQKDLERNPSTLRQFLLSAMVVLEPFRRGSARWCLDMVSGSGHLPSGPETILAIMRNRPIDNADIKNVLNLPFKSVKDDDNASTSESEDDDDDLSISGPENGDENQEPISGAPTSPAASEHYGAGNQAGLSQASPNQPPGLLFDEAGIVCMVIAGQSVSMQFADGSLNVSEILRAGALTIEERANYLRKLRRHTTIQGDVRHARAWIPFRDGVFLCQVLGLDEELMPLLAYARRALPSREDNYLIVYAQRLRRRSTMTAPNGYAILRWNDHKVPYKPGERLINATALLKAAGSSRWKLRDLWRHAPEVTKHVVNGGSSVISGTYISYEAAVILCALFGIDPAPVHSLDAARGAGVDVADGPSHEVDQEANEGHGYEANEEHVEASRPAELAWLAENDAARSGQRHADSVLGAADYQNDSYLAQAGQSHVRLLGRFVPRMSVGRIDDNYNVDDFYLGAGHNSESALLHDDPPADVIWPHGPD